jgi:hypothetical protein
MTDTFLRWTWAAELLPAYFRMSVKTCDGEVQSAS